MRLTADGLVLAGGRSRRMGQNKADLPYGSSTSLVQHARDVLEAAVSGMVWVSRPLTWNDPTENDIPDAVAAQGPLHGILQGLTRTHHEWLAVVAVDCPNVPPELYETLYRARRATDRVLIPYYGAVAQPLAALWSKALTDAIAKDLQAEQFKVQTLLDRVATHYIKVRQPDWLVNLNTPGDWENWRQTTGGRP